METGNNSLTGSITSELGRLSNLLALDIGTNKFSRSIPTEFGNISGLQNLILGKKSCS